MHREILRLENLHPLAEGQEQAYYNFTVEEGESLCVLTQDINTRLFLTTSLTGGNIYSYTGRIRIAGEEAVLDSVEQAQKRGIYQIDNRTLFPNLDVANNLFLTSLPASEKLGMLKNAPLYRSADQILEEFEIADFHSGTRVHHLTEFQRFILCFLRAAACGSKIILVDFTMARDYSDQELKTIQIVFQRLKEKKIAILCFAGVWLPLFLYCDRYATIRDGVITRCQYLQNRVPDFIQTEFRQDFSPVLQPQDERPVVLECRSYRYRSGGLPKILAFHLHKQEILGLLDPKRKLHVREDGIDHPSVNASFMETLFVNGQSCGVKASGKRKQTLLATVNYGFQNDSVFQPLDLAANITVLAGAPLYDRLGFLHGKMRRFMAVKVLKDINREDILEKYGRSKNLQGMSPEDQFVISICRWIYAKPKAFLFYNYAENYSMLSSTHIRALIQKIREMGYPIIIISPSTEELENYCDRIVRV